MKFRNNLKHTHPLKKRIMYDKTTLGFIFAILGLMAYYCEFYDMINYISYGCISEFMANFFLYSDGSNPLDYMILYILFSIIGRFEELKTVEAGRIILYANMSDAIQQLVGKRWGRLRIVKSISPNKTIEGYLGGFVFMSLVSYFTGLSVIYYFTGVVGDLVCSYSKRRMGIKDWSCILGSHGGILDRFNSSIFGIVFLLR